MIQQAIVAVIVLLAAWVVARKYLPKPLRRRIAAVCARQADTLGLARVAAWLATTLPAAANCADGCGSCGSCGTGGTATPVAPTPGTAGTEFAMPVEALRATIRRKP